MRPLKQEVNGLVAKRPVHLKITITIMAFMLSAQCSFVVCCIKYFDMDSDWLDSLASDWLSMFLIVHPMEKNHCETNSNDMFLCVVTFVVWTSLLS